MKENSILKKISILADLIKYRLSLAVTLSSVTGFFLGNKNPGPALIYTSAGVFLLASGAATLNQYEERRADSMMSRTLNRPLPSGNISGRTTLIISFLLFISGALLLSVNGFLPLVLGLLTVVLYNFVYTGLKTRTIFSIIPGALVGAIPPLIGYSSSGAMFFNGEILAFATFMFLWQLPHFWLILIRNESDYAKAGFATITRYLNNIQIRYLTFLWVLATTLFIILYFILTETMNGILISAIIMLNTGFIILFYRFLFGLHGVQKTKGAFILINSVSLIIMLFIILEAILK